MKHLRLVALLAFWVVCSPFLVKAADTSAELAVLALTRANNGQRVTAAVGQVIQIDLQTLAGAGYEKPQVSSPSVRYDNSVQAMPPNPGGPLPILVFEAVSVGEAEIRIPRRDAPGFGVTVEVSPASDKGEPNIQLDQSNTNGAGAGWTNLVTGAVQTFTPTLPKLLRVEVELVEANRSPERDSVTLVLLNANGDPLVTAVKTIAEDQPGWVSFVFANGGLSVAPGELYGIEVLGSNRFGWKYIENGYGRGEALFNGAPILKGAHASFLFRTLGAN